MTARKSRVQAKADRPVTVAAYLALLTAEKRAVIEEARGFVERHIPKGYVEFMNWGVINVDAFRKAGKRLDMGKCCVRFKALDDLELVSVAQVIAMSTPKKYIAYYKRVKGLA